MLAHSVTLRAARSAVVAGFSVIQKLSFPKHCWETGNKPAWLMFLTPDALKY